MTTPATTVKYRKLTLERSILLAYADLADHGPVVRRDVVFVAAYTNRCDACGWNLTIGERGTFAERPGVQPKLAVHEICPQTITLNYPHDVFTQLPWLLRWEGADLVSCWSRMQGGGGRCRRCRHPWGFEELAALVRWPGRIILGEQHSEWVCESCVRL